MWNLDPKVYFYFINIFKQYIYIYIYLLKSILCVFIFYCYNKLANNFIKKRGLFNSQCGRLTVHCWVTPSLCQCYRHAWLNHNITEETWENTCRNKELHHAHCASCCSVAIIKNYNQGNLYEKDYFLAYGFREYEFIIVAKHGSR